MQSRGKRARLSRGGTSGTSKRTRASNVGVSGDLGRRPFCRLLRVSATLERFRTEGRQTNAEGTRGRSRRQDFDLPTVGGARGLFSGEALVISFSGAVHGAPLGPARSGASRRLEPRAGPSGRRRLEAELGPTTDPFRRMIGPGHASPPGGDPGRATDPLLVLAGSHSARSL